MLPSRNFPSSQAFVESFLASLTPGIIPRTDFIQWHSIDAKLSELESPLLFYSELADRISDGADFLVEFRDSLLASDNPVPIVKCAFQLLGHTGDSFVSKEDDIELESTASRIQQRDENRADFLAHLLKDLGLLRVLERSDLSDLLLGVQIGLESHRRKNTGGESFKHEVELMLREVASRVTAAGRRLDIANEQKISYGQRLSKKVDFALTLDGTSRFGVEANFYTGTGSKPTEIKRSYGELLRGLKSVGVDLIWITDGKGYRDMNRSLGDAFEIVPNIYNLKQTQQHLAADLLSTV